MDTKEWAKLQESLLSEQLKVIRRFLKKGREMQTSPKRKSMSKINIAADILEASPTPLHVNEIIKKAKIDYQIDIDRESIVSAISKKVRKGDTFIRTARNTFGLKNKEYKP
jgi:hypothetical protein